MSKQLNDTIYSDLRQQTLIAYVTGIFINGSIFVFGSTSPVLAQVYNIDVSYLVKTNCLIMIGVATANYFGGKLISIFGPVKLIFVCSLLLAISWLMIPLFQFFPVYIAVIFVNGLIGGIVFPCVNFIIASSHTDNQVVNSNLNILNAIVGIGIFFKVFVSGYIISYLGWELIFIIFPITFIIVPFFLWFRNLLNVEITMSIQRNPDQQTSDDSFRNVVTLPLFFIATAVFLYVYMEFIITYWFAPYMAHNLEFDPKQIGLIFGAFWLTMATCRFFIGKYIVPITKDYFIISLSMILVIILIAIFCTLKGFASVFIVVLLLGGACSIVFPTLVGLGIRLDENKSPSVISFLMLMGTCGGIASLFFSAEIGRRIHKIYSIYTAIPICVLTIFFIILGRMKNKKDTKE